MIGLHWQNGNSTCPFEDLYTLMGNVDRAVKAVQVAMVEFEAAQYHSQQIESEVTEAQQMIEVYKNNQLQNQKAFTEGIRDFVGYLRTTATFMRDFDKVIKGLQQYLEDSVGGLIAQLNVQQLQSSVALQELLDFFHEFENNYKKGQDTLKQWSQVLTQLLKCHNETHLLKEKSLSKKQSEVACEQCLNTMTLPMQNAQMLLEGEQNVQDFVVNIPEQLEQLKGSCDSSAAIVHELYEGGGGEADQIGQERGQQADNTKEGGRSKSDQKFVSDAFQVFLGKLKGDENVTLKEQVDVLITTACDEKALSKMYEGWTAWL
eukprot:TRINITY_DN5748_c0_g1_i1.p1 TRINITY_DN5748_c0_g1~~TRINITY_DN5748_c0_g1_i1.p1  ORF type:complete len:318 (-),score=57.18 TRINITY_DN5748_c0_g1_i1:632-1585(-)